MSPWTWNEVERALRIGSQKEISIPKALLPHPSRAGAVRSFGMPRGQRDDWRFPPTREGSGLHVQDFGSEWRVHLDKVHPAIDLGRHLAVDVLRFGSGNGT